jgi:hypothetical protein
MIILLGTLAFILLFCAFSEDSPICGGISVALMGWCIVSLLSYDIRDRVITEEYVRVSIVDRVALVPDEYSKSKMKNVNVCFGKNFSDGDVVIKRVTSGMWVFGIYYPVSTEWDATDHIIIMPQLQQPNCPNGSCLPEGFNPFVPRPAPGPAVRAALAF